MALFMTKAFLRTYAMNADADGDNVVSTAEARAYFGTSKMARTFITILKIFRLVEDQQPKLQTEPAEAAHNKVD